MKIILSRKGFDSEYGGQPSPILPDGTLLSLPIPLPNDTLNYKELFHQGKSYYDIITELKPKTKKILPHYTCHLDPDIRMGALKRHEEWKPVFGQADAAQMHLANNNISLGDLFLFFGWFRKTVLENGRLIYERGSPDLHVIYGYLQIESTIKNNDEIPAFAKYHSHAHGDLSLNKTNCIYVAKDKLSLNENYPGASFLHFREDLVLTKKGLSRSKWELPEFFKELSITYHTKDSFKENYFKSAHKGQEFIISAQQSAASEANLLKWVKRVVTGGS